MFPTLVRMFYSNLKYVWGILNTKLKKHKIKQSLQEFAEIFNLPCLEYEAEGNNYSYLHVAPYFLLNPSSGIPTPF